MKAIADGRYGRAIAIWWIWEERSQLVEVGERSQFGGYGKAIAVGGSGEGRSLLVDVEGRSQFGRCGKGDRSWVEVVKAIAAWWSGEERSHLKVLGWTIAVLVDRMKSDCNYEGAITFAFLTREYKAVYYRDNHLAF